MFARVNHQEHAQVSGIYCSAAIFLLLDSVSSLQKGEIKPCAGYTTLMK